MPEAKATPDEPKREWKTTFLIATVVLAIILIIVGVSYYMIYVAPFHRTVIAVDNISINMGYFIKRTKQADSDPLTMLGVLTNEMVIKAAAPKCGIEATPEEIDLVLRGTASSGNETITESEFQEWYRQLLNETGFTDAEYRDYIATNILTSRLQDQLAQEMPTSAEQVHLHSILLSSYDDAEKVRARLEDGEDFADLAREVSLDTKYKEAGGDVGWIPRGVIYTGFDDTVFGLDIGVVSEPLIYVNPDPTSESEQEFYYLFMVSEKSASREISADHLEILKGNALEDWLAEEQKLHKIVWSGIKDSFDSETNAWINYQVSKK